MVISGTTCLAFKWEFFPIQNLVTGTKLLIQLAEEHLFTRSIFKQRKFPTSSNPAISSSQSRDSTSVFTKKTKAFILVVPDISRETLDNILKPIDQEASCFQKTFIENIRSENLENRKLETIRTVGADVLGL